MGQILRNWRVISALGFALLLILGSFILARGLDFTELVQASTEAALLEAIAKKDTDNDGLPDWEEALYDTDPNRTDTLNLGMTDGEAVGKGLVVPKAVVGDTPKVTASADEGSLTDAFAQAFFALYLAAKESNGGTDLSADETHALASRALTQFIETSIPIPDFKKKEDLLIAQTGAESLRVFAAAAEGVFNRYQSDAPINELRTIQQVLQGNDAQAVSSLTTASKIYREYAVGLAALSVPEELAEAVRALINALKTRGDIYDAFTRIDTDPLVAILSLQQLSGNEIALREAFAAIGTVYRFAGIALPDGVPGAMFISAVLSFGATNP